MSNEFNKGRRKFIKSAFTVASALAIAKVAPTWAAPQGRSFKDQILTNDEIDLTIAKSPLLVGNKVGTPITINGQMPGPLIRLKEGQRAKLNVTNRLSEDTSIHWHGIILPENMDGVPGVSFEGIKPGRTFKYRYDVEQNGTYWYHSHSGLQEQLGHLGPLVIEPKDGDIGADREHTIILSDWTFEDPDTVFRNLKVAEGYYNYQKRTIFETFEDVRQQGLEKTWKQREMWGQMRMSPRDIADVTGSTYTYLMNGRDSAMNWSALFKPGEKVRLRIINGSAMSFFDVRIPGLEMTVVAADGQPVKPVPVDEFRIGVAETYDVIVRPRDKQAYTIFAESMGRSGYARATLAPEEGMEAAVPPLREPARLTMADMGNMHGMDHGNMDMGSSEGVSGMDHSNMGSMDHSNMKGMDHSNMKGMDHSDMSGMDHGSMAMGKGGPSDPFYAKGSGLVPTAANGGKFLSYADLKAQDPLYEDREPTREIELRLTGNMERYTWSINGVKYEDADPIRLKYGERVRFKFVNETMMTHPMHLHGMWSILDVGAGQWNPIKHTVSVNPGTTVYMETEVDEPGQWAFHCHLSYHAAAGMFRKVIVEGGPESTQAKTGVVAEDGGEA